MNKSHSTKVLVALSSALLGAGVANFVSQQIVHAADQKTQSTDDTNTTVSGVIVANKAVTVYDSPKGGQPTGQILDQGTAWKFDQEDTDENGDYWYRVGDNAWVRASDMSVQTDAGKPSTPVFHNDAKGIMTVNDDVQLNVQNNANADDTYFTGQILAPGTSWKYDQMIEMPDGTNWYRVGMGQYVQTTGTTTNDQNTPAEDIYTPNAAYIKSLFMSKINMPDYGKIWGVTPISEHVYVQVDPERETVTGNDSSLDSDEKVAQKLYDSFMNADLPASLANKSYVSAVVSSVQVNGSIDRNHENTGDGVSVELNLNWFVDSNL